MIRFKYTLQAVKNSLLASLQLNSFVLKPLSLPSQTAQKLPEIIENVDLKPNFKGKIKMLLGHVSKVKKLMAMICLFGLCLGQGYSSEHILIVDDNDVPKKVYAKYFTKNNYIVTFASNTEEALEKLRSNQQIRRVLTDVNMVYSGEGFDLARCISVMYGDTVHVSIHSSCPNNCEQEYREKARNSGARNFFLKSLIVTDILETIVHINEANL